MATLVLLAAVAAVALVVFPIMKIQIGYDNVQMYSNGNSRWELRKGFHSLPV